ncbi:MAG: HIT family protein [Acidimicrobiia bacterium]|nr:HIT family protein [Acidimicrobiia bacterium]
MATVFTKIIDGEIPGRFVWRDERCVAFSTIAPLRPGHVMVVPIAEVDHWLALDPDLAAHLFGVAQVIGQALMSAFSPVRVGLVIAGLEVPHTHLHVIPIDSEADLDFARADHEASPASLDDAADALRSALRAAGRTETADS